MKHIFKLPHEKLFIRSMGKSFAVMAIFTNDKDTNTYCEKHDEAAVIACHGDFIFVANKYDASQT